MGISSPQPGFHSPRVHSSLGPRTRGRVWRSCGSPTPLRRGRWQVVEREVGTPLPRGVVVGALIPVNEDFWRTRLWRICRLLMLLRGLNEAWNTYFQGLLSGAKLMAVVQSTSTWMSLRASSSCSAAGGVFLTWKQQLNLLPIVKVSSFDTLKKIYHKGIDSIRRINLRNSISTRPNIYPASRSWIRGQIHFDLNWLIVGSKRI